MHRLNMKVSAWTARLRDVALAHTVVLLSNMHGQELVELRNRSATILNGAAPLAKFVGVRQFGSWFFVLPMILLKWVLDDPKSEVFTYYLFLAILGDMQLAYDSLLSLDRMRTDYIEVQVQLERLEAACHVEAARLDTIKPTESNVGHIASSPRTAASSPTDPSGSPTRSPSPLSPRSAGFGTDQTVFTRHGGASTGTGAGAGTDAASVDVVVELAPYSQQPRASRPPPIDTTGASHARSSLSITSPTAASRAKSGTPTPRSRTLHDLLSLSARHGAGSSPRSVSRRYGSHRSVSAVFAGRGGLVVSDATIGYEGVVSADPAAGSPQPTVILRGVSFTIAPGTTVGIVGETGSGKTTLLRALTGLLAPLSGSVTAGGTDIYGGDVTRWWHSICVVPQGARLFERTVRENVTYGLHDVPDAAIRRAAEQALAWDFVRDLPGGAGLDTVLEGGGEQLSGGQRQRLHLVRAFVRDSGWLILDEPMAALDGRTQARVTANLKAALAARRPRPTCIVVTHRAAVLSMCDLVLEVADGTVRRLEAGGIEEEVGPLGVHADGTTAAGAAMTSEARAVAASSPTPTVPARHAEPATLEAPLDTTSNPASTARRATHDAEAPARLTPGRSD